MKVAWVVLATALALSLQTTLARFVIRGTVAVDLVLVVVVYTALTSGSVTGLLTGTFAGLVQDALSSGVIGIGGLAKTVVGFLAGIIGTQFIVAQPLPRMVVFFAATILHAVLFIGLYEFSIYASLACRSGRSRGRPWATQLWVWWHFSWLSFSLGRWNAGVWAGPGSAAERLEF